jgi:hypothetical protein|tara:strand:- start:231 stop:395 length:165 start_codon:yes stop_codon:yes gene_type:complete
MYDEKTVKKIEEFKGKLDTLCKEYDVGLVTVPQPDQIVVVPNKKKESEIITPDK